MKRARKRRQRKPAGTGRRRPPPGRVPAAASPEIQRALGAAVGHHGAGGLAEAERLYRDILAADPGHPAALHLLGVIGLQKGQPEVAVELIGKALARNPDDADAHANLGVALKTLGRLDDAVASFRRALALKPDHAEAHNNLGDALNEQGRLDDAVASFRRALARKPDFAEAHNNLGNALRDQGRPEDAAASFRAALAVNPDYALAHYNLGNALRDLGRPADAAASFEKASALEPGFAEAHANLGLAFRDLGRPADAVARFEKALAARPDDAEALSNMGVALSDLGRLGDAVERYRAALALRPDFTEALNNLAMALKDLGKPAEAIAGFRAALAADPGYVGAARNLLYALLNVPGLSPEELFAEHARFADAHAPAAGPAPDLANDPDPERRLRVGYLTSDFRDHPVGTVTLPLVSNHDPGQVEVTCYADVTRPDAVTERFRSSADHWRDIAGKSDADVAAMARADGIDVLVLLAGRFDNNRPLVAAHRAAPVQVSLHDGATSGLQDMDYWLTDDYLHPPGTAERFTEELWRLPVFYQWPPIEDAPPVAPPPAGDAGRVTFASFNNPAKISEDVIKLWARVLDAVPGAGLRLKYKNWYAEPAVRERVADGLAAAGVEGDRVTFLAEIDTRADYLGRHAGVDVALDTFPFNGATTTFQALWMGVPVVSLAGQTFISRAAGSLLHHAGLGELAVGTADDYVERARALAADPEGLAALRAGLRDRVAASPLCDAPAYAQSVEAAFREMWRRWCAGRRGPA